MGRRDSCRVAAEAVRLTGHRPGEVVLTCPESWGRARRAILARAAEHAGLVDVAFVTEPVAAATYLTEVTGATLPSGAVKLLFGLLDHPSVEPAAEMEAEPVRVPTLVPEALPGTVPLVVDGPAAPVPTIGDGRAVRDEPPNESDSVVVGGNETETAEEPAPDPVSVLPSTLDVSALLPAARNARAKLVSAGQAVSRDALARQMRADGHAASNTRVSAVLKALSAEVANSEAAA